jgi:hypothetical protein
MGLQIQNGVYVYAEVNDGYVSRGDTDPMHRVNDDKERREFPSRAKFVEWLAAQTDESLSGRDQANDWYHDNQRITVERLQEFLFSTYHYLSEQEMKQVRKIARLAMRTTAARLAALGFSDKTRGRYSLNIDGRLCHFKLGPSRDWKCKYVPEAWIGDDLDDVLTTETRFLVALVDNSEQFADKVGNYVKQVVIPWYRSTIELGDL